MILALICFVLMLLALHGWWLAPVGMMALFLSGAARPQR